MLEAYFGFAIMICLVGTHVRRSSPVSAVALATIVPAVVLATVTTPKGDNDGLWILIFPMLAILFGVAVVLGRLYRRFINAKVILRRRR